MNRVTTMPNSALSTMQSRAQGRSMWEAAEDLVENYADDFPAGDVLAAVSQAKAHARSLLAENGAVTPPPHEYVALICRLARRDLDARRRVDAADGGALAPAK